MARIWQPAFGSASPATGGGDELEEEWAIHLGTEAETPGGPPTCTLSSQRWASLPTPRLAPRALYSGPPGHLGF